MTSDPPNDDFTSDASPDDPDASPDDPDAPNDDPPLTPGVRRACPSDTAALSRLQSYLREPSPDLLEYGIAVGDVQVAVGSTPDDSFGRNAPVGYVLPVPGENGVHVAELVVAPGARREGHAARLLRAVVARADGPVTVLVASDNEAGLALYEDLGFRRVGRRPDVYDDGDALLMRRDRS